MLSYVTPARARLMGLGLGTVSDTDLSAALRRASRRVNAFCGTANRPQPHDFRGGTITDEKRDWALPSSPVDAGQDYLFTYHWPIIEVTSFRIYVTNGQYVEIQPDEVIVTDRRLEVVSLAYTSVGLFGGGIGPIIGMKQAQARVSYTYGERFEVVGEELVNSGDDLTFRAENQFWTSEDDLTLYLNGVAQTLPTVDLEEGTVTFGAPVTGVRVTLDYTHTLDPDIAEATGIILGQELDIADLRSKGLTGLQRVRVGEIEMERARSGSVSGNADPTDIPASAKLLLAGRQSLWAGS